MLAAAHLGLVETEALTQVFPRLPQFCPNSLLLKKQKHRKLSFM